jgi:hypothetical protein
MKKLLISLLATLALGTASATVPAEKWSEIKIAPNTGRLLFKPESFRVTPRDRANTDYYFQMEFKLVDPDGQSMVLMGIILYSSCVNNGGGLIFNYDDNGRVRRAVENHWTEAGLRRFDFAGKQICKTLEETPVK